MTDCLDADTPVAAPPLRALLTKLAKMGGRTADLLFPPACAFCAGELEDASAPLLLCDQCVVAMLPRPRVVCPRCGTLLGVAGQRCVVCVEHRIRIDALIALGDYQSELREAVLRTKHARDSVLARALARLLWRERGAELMDWRADVVAPVPMHWMRRAWRGVNSPETIATLLADELSLPVSNLLQRRRRTPSLGPLSAQRRRAVVRAAFRLRRPEDFRGARVLVVDDVVTSGATSSAIARLFRKAGAEFVGLAAVCRTQSPISRTIGS